jgi:hypothetical protein
MPKKKVADIATVESQGEKPIILVGQPGALRGELFLHNPGEARMIFRGAELRGRAAEVPKAAKPVEQMMVARKVPAVIVKPGERRRVPLRFALDPTTPPGEYKASLQMADQSWPVVFQVTERIDLDISPSVLVIHNRPGATVVKEIVLRNDGNVELAIDEISAVPLDDELAQCRILRAVAAAIGSQEESDLDDILTEFAHQSKAVLDQAGILRVRNRSGSFILQPGEVRRIEVEIRLPDSLDKRTRYRAVMPIYNADLTISIVPSLDIQNPDKPKVN